MNRLRDRLATRGDDGVAMMTAIMMMLILMSLSVVVLGMVVSQVTPTQFARKNTETVFAAEAGVETALGRIRTAQSGPDFTGVVYGKANKLPCTVTGTVGPAGAETTYSTTVRYYLDDPTGKSASWLSANQLVCTPGAGTGAALPSFAYIESAGDAPAAGNVESSQGDRAIAMVYRFETTTTNIKGGRIFSWANGTEAQFCLRATGTAAGSTVQYQPLATCGSAAHEATELWVYDTDYALKLASSTLTSTPLCMTNESGTIYLRACTGGHTQAFAWHPNGNATWVAQDASFNDVLTMCLKSSQSTGVPSNGSTLRVGACANQAAWGAFAPDPAVGPGAASINTKQIVNFLEFGRCFDVTDTTVTRPFMISYPCKQDPPSGTGVFWNHRWYYEEPLVGTTAAPQQIWIHQSNDPARKYCLKAPTSQTDPTESGVGAGYYPTLTSCSAGDPTQRWTRSTATGVKATSWTIRDSSGRCVGVGGSKYLDKWSALVVSACDGSAAQKWNAPADSVEAKVGGYLEEKG